MSKKAVIIGIFVFLSVTNVSSQTLTATHGEMHYLVPGHTYTLRPIPGSDTSVNPIITGAEWGEPMTFALNAPAGTQFRVSFILTGDEAICGSSISSSFYTNALRWEEKDVRFDPTNAQIITADSNGKATLDLGISITIQSNTRRHSYQARVNCLMVSLQTGDSLASSAGFYSDGGDLSTTAVDGDMTNLSRGYTYSLTPNTSPSPITPLINGHEQGRTAQLQTDVGYGTPVRVVFILPTHLIGDDGNYSLPCGFKSDAIYVEETGERFDPNRPDTITQGSGCTLTLDVGITLSVPSDAVTGGYTAQIILEASYIGNSKSMPPGGMRSEMEMLIGVRVSDYDIPASISLLQNYPNPFNSSTTITYGLPEPASVTLKIFDLLGREITTLIHGYQYAGWHTIDWKADEVASGAYVYKLAAGNFTQAKKVLLVR